MLSDLIELCEKCNNSGDTELPNCRHFDNFRARSGNVIYHKAGHIICEMYIKKVKIVEVEQKEKLF